MRTTLPLIFGADARLALDLVPAGAFVSGGDLLHELPKRGITLALPARGQTLKVWSHHASGP